MIASKPASSTEAWVPRYPAFGLADRSLNLLFPPICVGCRRVGRWICPHCWPSVEWADVRRCEQCDRPSGETPCVSCRRVASPFESLVGVSRYEGTAREAVHALKFAERHAIAGLLGKLMAEVVDGFVADVLVPVPLHKKRRRERGYDQSVLLSKVISRQLGIALDWDALERTRATKQQAVLEAEERLQNVAGAFLTRRELRGKTVLLIDDVSTTGATLRTAASALKDAGAGAITALVFAKT